MTRVWILCCDVMSWATIVWIPGILISLRRACVCEISLWMCVSWLLSKNKLSIVWLLEVFIKSFVTIEYAVSLFEVELASRHNFLSAVSATIVSPSSSISLILVVNLSQISRWRELTWIMVVALSGKMWIKGDKICHDIIKCQCMKKLTCRCIKCIILLI